MEIWLYVAESNPPAADRLVAAIEAKCSYLAGSPGLGRPREDLAPGLRSFAVRNYVIFYRPLEDGIELIRVLHGAREIRGVFGHGETEP